MSRPLVALCLLAAGIAGLAPLAVMAARVSPADLATVLDARTLDLLGRTLALGAGAAVLAFAAGVPFGFLTARTNVPGAGLLRPLGVVPLLLPPLVLAMSWIVLVDLRGAALAILILAAGTFPLVAVFTAAAWERIDARREEAALLVGGSWAAVRMGFPLVLPPALCGASLAFVFAINDFAVPDYVSSLGPKFNVYADEVFATWQIDHADGKAVATALPLVALTLAFLLPALALRRSGSLATVDGDFRRPAPLDLGRWRWPAAFACAALVTLAALVPVGRMLWEAGGGAQGWSVAGLRGAFARAIELCGDNLAASLGYATSAATVAVPLAFVLGHALERARRGRLFEWALVLPVAVPGILFGIGTIVLWNHPLWNAPALRGLGVASFYTGGGLVVLMWTGRFLAFPALVASGAVASFDRRLEEAAELAGAGPIRRLVAIVAPGLWPSLAGGWTLVFVLAMRELDAAILVPAANETVMIRLFNGVHFGRDDFVAALALLIVFVIVTPGLLWSLFARRRMQVVA